MTGHSLGGAMARAFMETYKSSQYTAITYAAPSYGPLDTADPRITRIEINKDPVADAGISNGWELDFAGTNWPIAYTSTLHSMDAYRQIMRQVTASEFQQFVGIAGSGSAEILINARIDGPLTAQTIGSANGGQLSGNVDQFYALSGNDTVSDIIGNDFDILFGGAGDDTLAGDQTMKF
ncbi:MAG: hypothetical protein IPK02_20750 [Candidatus Accumulibacter sp.]|uniref:Lipase n=1 Tax=Candidatus Accumulibacter affinis TaxID=2954384 RepID=A0A935TCR5_9PROT|nr:hypothetical protein [Candidatus Accumulibacter affinis]